MAKEEVAHPWKSEKRQNNFLFLLSQVFPGPAPSRGPSSAQDSLYPTLFLELYPQTSPDSTLPQVPDTLVALTICKEPRSALESRRVSLGAHWVDSRESSLLRRLERGREIGL